MLPETGETMSAQPQSFLTPEEYLAFERQADFKSEYFQGETFAMAGTSRRHNRLVVNLTIRLGGKLLPKGCEVFANDMRVKVEANGLYTYPDLAVVCSEPRFEDTELDTLLNPELLIEVLSPSTEAYDRGRKFDLYRQLDSLTDYLLVAQEQVQVLHYRKQASGDWLLHESTALTDSLRLEEWGLKLPLSELYAGIEWEVSAESASDLSSS